MRVGVNRIFSLRGNDLVAYLKLVFTPIIVVAPNQESEWLCTCILEVSIFRRFLQFSDRTMELFWWCEILGCFLLAFVSWGYLSPILIFDLGIRLTEWYICFSLFFFIPFFWIHKERNVHTTYSLANQIKTVTSSLFCKLNKNNDKYIIIHNTHDNIEMLWSDKPSVSEKTTLNSCKATSSLCILYSNSDVLSMLTYVILYEGFPPSVFVYLIYFSYFHIHVKYIRNESVHGACNHTPGFFKYWCL